MTNRIDVWAVLGDATRREIFARLAERPCAVAELARRLPVTRPAVSQHLKVMKDAGLVTEQVDGTRHIYQLDPAGVDAFRSQIEQFWSITLTTLKMEVEESTEEE